MERQCPVCGETVIEDTIEFCPVCGTELPQAHPEFEDEYVADETYVMEEMEDTAEVEEADEEGESDYVPPLEDEEVSEELEKEEYEARPLEEEDTGERAEKLEETETEPKEENLGDVTEEMEKDTVAEGDMTAEEDSARSEDKKPPTGEEMSDKERKRKKSTKKRSKKKKVRKRKTEEGKRTLSEREERKRRLREELEKGGTKRDIFNYYAINTGTLIFFAILAIFTLAEFLLLEFNITASAPRVLFSFAPILEPVIGRAGAPILFLVALLTGIDAALHYWDRKRNLWISLLVTGIMIFGLALAFATATDGDALTLLLTMGFMMFILALDYISIMKYPAVLEEPGRDNLEEYLLKEEEIEALLQEEEEKLSLKEQQIEELQQQIDMMGDQLAEEEEKLRMKDEELARIQAEIQMKEQELLAEEEEIRMKEQELSTVIEQELKRRMEDQLMEEEERLRMKEEELIRARNELEIQRKLHEEAREKLRMKEQELNTLRSELEKQIRERLEEEEMLKMKEAATRMKEREKQKRILYPFTAIVGQEDMKKALILNAIYPEIGGVLIRGQKGTGKSVSVRGLAEVLPDIDISGCRFNCDPSDVENLCPECRAKYEKGMLESFNRPVRVVDLPLNITEDRLLGSIDIEKILKEGVRSFEPGLLAETHRGILYVDEINLLDDYIVDLLLDAASSGRVVIEREGISFTHPARFIIVGSMNPEEGELRPQLLDRLELQVDVVGIKNVEERMEIVRRRKEFTENPQLFREKYREKQEELRRRITEAREKLDSITTPPNIMDIIGKLCVEFEVDGHRADIIIERAARANAAFEGRKEVTIEDVIVAASYALPHRARKREEEFSREVVEKAIRRLEKEVS